VTQPPVIVGIDRSAAAQENIRQAGAWAQRIGAPLVIAHVAPDEVIRALETPGHMDTLRLRVEKVLGAGVPAFEVVILAGSPHAALVQLADERNAALIVVGASGEGTIGRRLFGTTAEHVVRYAHCPVLVSRPSPKDGVVLCATDFSDEATGAVSAAGAEARLRAVPLRLVHCLHEPTWSLSLLGPMIISLPEMPEAEREELKEAAFATLKSLLASTGVAGACEVLLGPPTSTIVEEAAGLSAGLVVVGTKGRTGLARAALGSVAEAIARTAPCSVLAVRNGARQPK
jgi:nucleotide-binding universal stress UspA family protein